MWKRERWSQGQTDTNEMKNRLVITNLKDGSEPYTKEGEQPLESGAGE